MKVTIETSIGELIDKMSILRVKRIMIKDSNKLKNVSEEYDVLSETVRILDLQIPSDVVDELDYVNTKLWDVEDKLRKKEAEESFDEEFIALARSVYKLNDRRFTLKQKLNIEFGSKIREEKEYVKYE